MLHLDRSALTEIKRRLEKEYYTMCLYLGKQATLDVPSGETVDKKKSQDLSHK